MFHAEGGNSEKRVSEKSYNKELYNLYKESMITKIVKAQKIG